MRWKRWAIMFICLGIIAARFVKPDLRVDATTVLLFAIAGLMFFMPELQTLAPYIKRIRFGDTEIELQEQVKKLGREVEQAQDRVAQQAAQAVEPSQQAEVPPHEVAPHEVVPDTQRLLRDSAADPRAAFILLSGMIERVVNERLRAAGINMGQRYAPLPKAVEAGVKAGIFPEAILGSVRDFWGTRNRVVHGAAFDVQESTILSLISIGLDILRILTVP